MRAPPYFGTVLGQQTPHVDSLGGYICSLTCSGQSHGVSFGHRHAQDSKAGLLGVPALMNRQEQWTDPKRELPAGLVIRTASPLMSSPALPGPESTGSDFVRVPSFTPRPKAPFPPPILWIGITFCQESALTSSGVQGLGWGLLAEPCGHLPPPADLGPVGPGSPGLRCRPQPLQPCPPGRGILQGLRDEAAPGSNQIPIISRLRDVRGSVVPAPCQGSVLGIQGRTDGDPL